MLRRPSVLLDRRASCLERSGADGGTTLIASTSLHTRASMAHIHLPPGWQGREQDAPDRSTYENRRTFIKRLGMGTVGLAAGTSLGCTTDGGRSAANDPSGPLDTIPANAPREGYPAARNNAYPVPERETSSRLITSSYNNYYEFKHQGDLKKVWPLTGQYEPFPMTLAVGGLVEEEQTLDVAPLIRFMELEERLYRFRCVEAWSLTVPWTGFPLRDLIDRCKPLSKATHVRFFSVNRPKEMPAATGGYYEFPYYEGLRMDEAVNELAFVATGVYGEPLPKQNGSPLRLVLPWKYGYKNAKAIDRIAFVDEEPPTFWNDEAPSEYGFLSNVNPNVPHPRWSQAQEEFLVDEDTKREVDTQIFNGYDEWVADLYPDEPRFPTQPMAR